MATTCSLSRAFLRRVVALCLLLAMVIAGTRVDAALTGGIAGTVVDGQTSKPVVGAVINIASASGRSATVTDAKGSFSVIGLDFDTYVVSVTAKGYLPVFFQGVNVTGDEITRITATISHDVKTIGTVKSRSLSSAYQPDQTIDRYTINASGIEELLGKTFNTDGTRLLAELPGVTVDTKGTPLIRGGTSFETSLNFEGIDYTTPSRNVTNRFQNAGNSNLLNGVNSLEIVPGGGDATRGDTGTGLIAFTAKRGRWPAFAALDYEFNSTPRREGQFGAEYGIATRNNSFSNYISYIGADRYFQYGPYGTNAATLGASPIAPDVNLNGNVNAHFGALYTSAAFNTAYQSSRDLVDNLVFHFGKDQQQSLQLFIQSQTIRQELNYGGYAGLTTPGVQFAAGNGPLLGLFGDVNDVNNLTGVAGRVNPGQIDANIISAGVLSNYAGSGAPATPLQGPGTAFSPFSVFKLEYGNALNASTALAARFYRTFSDQQQYEPDQGLYVPQNGGTRTGFATDLTKTLGGGKHLLQFGGKFEFAVPTGTASNNVDYATGLTIVGTSVQPDFIVPQAATQIYGGAAASDGTPLTITTSGTPGCIGTPVSNTDINGNKYAPNISLAASCGYLSKFFNGPIPAIPAEYEKPTARQQVYGIYVQDTWSPSARIKALIGLRLDGYNFLLPDDPLNPPAVDGIRHQRLFEPHLGLRYQLRLRDTVRVNFGRTLSIPLPTFIGSDIDRSAYAAFSRIPSYNNVTGKPATYCGPGAPVANSAGAVFEYIGKQTCANYADQLYWLYRNYRFGAQGQLNTPLRGATFTNYDASYSHEFKDGTAIKVTPFYRRGYDVVEVTRSLIGRDPITTAEILSPEVYSNQGLQKATGVEFQLTKIRPVGFSGQLSATYINQLGNDPPGSYLPTQSLALGLLYNSPNLAPFQSTLALTYRTRDGWRINPVINFHSGYPYGQGVFAAQTVNGQIIYVPVTDATTFGNQGASFANVQIDPQNPGTVNAPNVIASRGTEAFGSAPGSLRSKSQFNANLTIEHRAVGGLTIGASITNLFDTTADIPTRNFTLETVPIANGINATTGKLTAAPNSSAYGTPTTVGPGYLPYIVFPNQPPVAIRVYMQVNL